MCLDIYIFLLAGLVDSYPDYITSSGGCTFRSLVRSQICVSERTNLKNLSIFNLGITVIYFLYSRNIRFRLSFPFWRKKLAKITTTVSCYVLYIFFIGLTGIFGISTDQVGDFCVVTYSSLSASHSFSFSLVLFVFSSASSLSLSRENYFSLFPWFSSLSVHLSNFFVRFFPLVISSRKTDFEIDCLSSPICPWSRSSEMRNFRIISSRTLIRSYTKVATACIPVAFCYIDHSSLFT